IPTSNLFISLRTFPSLPGLYKLPFHTPILPTLLQPLNDDEGAPAFSRPPHRARPCASVGTKPLLPFTISLFFLCMIFSPGARLLHWAPRTSAVVVHLTRSTFRQQQTHI